MSMNENMSEEQILDQLFEAAERLPEENVRIQRLDLLLTLRGLTSSKVDHIRERCTIRKTTKGRTEEKVDTETFNALLISEATVKLKVRSLELSGWGDTRITGRMKLSGGEQAVRRMLLAGELDAVGDKVLELSGFGVEIEDLKTDSLRRNDHVPVSHVGTSSSPARRVLVFATWGALAVNCVLGRGNVSDNFANESITK